jgi:hypothetical protein
VPVFTPAAVVETRPNAAAHTHLAESRKLTEAWATQGGSDELVAIFGKIQAALEALAKS